MKKHLNTLFVTKDNCYLSLEGTTVLIKNNGQTLMQIPLLNLEGIVTMSYDAMVSPYLIAACAESGIAITFCSPQGRFLAATRGFTSGNVLLRKAQYRQSDEPDTSTCIARSMIAAKLCNTRTLVMRAIRDHGENPQLQQTTQILARNAQASLKAETLDTLRGLEGDAATAYFSTFSQLIQQPNFPFTNRNRRPPTDAVNALLSFCYSLLAHDCRSALESVGLDAAVGFLHRDRPGRPSLALDLMEEFRPTIADRCVLTLINRKQITPLDFTHTEANAIIMTPDARKTVLTAWQERKKEEIHHPFLDEKITYGLLPFIQARLLARYIRKDLDAYPAYIWK